jgi:hypothetical protein
MAGSDIFRKISVAFFEEKQNGEFYHDAPGTGDTGRVISESSLNYLLFGTTVAIRDASQTSSPLT